jgi:diguanylate cyclase (GGDEF)-like protein
VVALFVGAIVGALWLHDLEQRDQIERSLRATDSGQRILDSVVAMENATRDFTFVHDERALARFDASQQLEEQAAVSARASVDGGSSPAASLRDEESVVARWQVLALADIDRARRGDTSVAPATAAAERDLVLDDLRAANASFQRAVTQSGVDERDHISTLGTVAVLGLGGVFALANYLFFIRIEQREARFQARQLRFAEELQLVPALDHAARVLARHIRRSMRAATVDVQLAGEHEEPPLPDDTSVAVDSENGKVVARRLVAGGRGIGVVRVTSDRRLRTRERACLDDSVLRAAPVLASLRMLVIAQSQAATDVLTGLGNRRLIEDALDRLVAQSRRTGESFAVVMIDVDGFKAVNDEFGHQRGDDVLVRIAGALQVSTRPYDIVGRRGGDEFIMLLSRVDVDAATAIADRCRRAVDELHVMAAGAQITASFGLAIASPPDVETGALVRTADAALYEAKASGGNAVVVASNDGSLRSATAARIVAEL